VGRYSLPPLVGTICPNCGECAIPGLSGVTNVMPDARVECKHCHAQLERVSSPPGHITTHHYSLVRTAPPPDRPDGVSELQAKILRKRQLRGPVRRPRR
jgi:hypothetical protein